MKRLLLVFTLMFAIITISNSQIVDKKIFNSKSDTLTAGVTKSYVLELKGKIPYTITTQITIDSVSGDPNYSVYNQYSLDGIDYFNLDTATHTTGVDSTMTYSNLTHFPGTFLKINIVATDSVQKGTIKGNVKTWYKY